MSTVPDKLSCEEPCVQRYHEADFENMPCKTYSANMQCKHAMQTCKATLNKDTAVQLAVYCISRYAWRTVSRVVCTCLDVLYLLQLLFG